MTLIASYSFDGIPVLIADTLVSAPVRDRKHADLPFCRINIEDGASRDKLAPAFLASKLGVFGDFAIAYTGSVEKGEAALNTIGLLYDIGQLREEDVFRELASSVADTSGGEVAFIAHMIKGDCLTSLAFGAAVTSVGTTKVAGSGANWFLDFVNQPRGSVTTPNVQSEHWSDRWHDKVFMLIGSLMCATHSDGGTLEHGFGGFYEAVAVKQDDGGRLSYKRLTDCTHVEWQVYEAESEHVGLLDGQVKLGDVLIPSSPYSVLVNKRLDAFSIVHCVGFDERFDASKATAVLKPPHMNVSELPLNSIDDLMRDGNWNTEFVHIIVTSSLWPNAVGSVVFHRPDAGTTATTSELAHEGIAILVADYHSQVVIGPSVINRIRDIVMSLVGERTRFIVDINSSVRPCDDSGNPL